MRHRAARGAEALTETNIILLSELRLHSHVRLAANRHREQDSRPVEVAERRERTYHTHERGSAKIEATSVQCRCSFVRFKTNKTVSRQEAVVSTTVGSCQGPIRVAGIQPTLAMLHTQLAVFSTSRRRVYRRHTTSQDLRCHGGLFSLNKKRSRFGVRLFSPQTCC